MLSRLKKSRPEQWCAVAVHPRRVELAQIVRDGAGRPRVRLYASVLVQGSELDAIQVLRRQQRLDQFRVTTVLEPGEYQLHVVEAPNVPEAELKTAVRWKVKDLLEYPADAATVDVLPVPADRGGRGRNVFAVTARNDHIAWCMKLFEDAKVPLESIDIPELAQRNVAALYEEPGRGLALLTFGDTGAMLTITSGGELYVSRSFDVSAEHLEHAAGEARTGLLERVVLELQRSLDHFDRQFGGVPVARLLIAPFTGADGVRQFLADNLYVPVDILDLNDVLDLNEVPQLLPPEAQTRGLQIIGAALREEIEPAAR
jgi:MSHA biogenesis protein MshI